MQKSEFLYSYCGGVADRQHADHFIPKCMGGDDSEGNLFPACRSCNSTKGGKSFDDARHLLVLRKIGWPKFTKSQIEWMRQRDFDLSEYDQCKLHFEEHGKPAFAPREVPIPALRGEVGRNARGRFERLPASAFFEGVRL